MLPRRLSFSDEHAPACIGCLVVNSFGGVCKVCFPHVLVMHSCVVCRVDSIFPNSDVVCVSCLDRVNNVDYVDHVN
jgi:hypothetical protein